MGVDFVKEILGHMICGVVPLIKLMNDGKLGLQVTSQMPVCFCSKGTLGRWNGS